MNKKDKRIQPSLPPDQVERALYIRAYRNLPNIEILGAGFEKSTKIRKPRITSNHRFYSMHYIMEGKGTLITGNQVFHLSAGNIFYLFPHNKLAYMPDTKSPWSYAWIDFSGEGISPFLAQLNVTPESPSFRMLKQETAKKIQEQMSNALNEANKKRLLSGLILTNLFYNIHNTLFEQCTASAHLQKNDPIISDVLQFIDTNYADAKFNIDTVAEHFNYHRGSLARILKKHTGQTFSEHLLDARMKAAIILMHSGETVISKIAYSVGFTDPLYFSKQFHALYDKSPSEYISEIKKDD